MSLFSGKVDSFSTPWAVTHHISMESPWDFPGKNAGVGCRFLLQGIFPTPGSSTRLPHRSGFFTTELPEKPVPCCLSFLKVRVCICQPRLPVHPPPSPASAATHLSSRSGVCVCLADKFIRISLLLTAKYCSTVWPGPSGFRWSGDGHARCFRLLAIADRVVLDAQVQAHACLYTRFWIFGDASPRSGALGPEATLQLSY